MDYVVRFASSSQDRDAAYWRRCPTWPRSSCTRNWRGESFFRKRDYVPEGAPFKDQGVPHLLMLKPLVR